MGDSARSKRREQLKRWASSCTNKASDVPRRRWHGAVDPEAEPSEPPREPPVCGGRDETSPQFKRRGDTEEAEVMLMEAKETKITNGEEVLEIINCSNADGITALHQSCIDGSMDIVSFLLEHGADQGASLSAVNCDGDVPMDIALDEATESLLQSYTVRLGVDLDAAKRLEEEQIMADARTWLTEGLPADVRHPKTGATPLHVAAAKGYQEALKILCQCELDVSAKDLDGWTPLHAAAHWGSDTI
ncbi:hypothetical protein F7725_005240 [Dissostichus mawsoni]|uniref:Uncharacterized protein n=1 Tax=Dissostichus mawsoni TaxID=36200 RepID=A0A7J5YR08_DISMA|nr:hypothetical protein F7725_005240 [Dissostichus mawsoni]